MSSIGENVDDRLSQLPEDTLSHILSLMPTKYAVGTSVLSKRWRYSWMYVNNLDFDDDETHPVYDGGDVLTEFVDGVLKHCKSSQVNLFRLHFANIWVQSSSVTSWINGAVKLNVNELDIQVHNLGLPLSMLTCKTLTKLRLKYFVFNSDVWEFPCQVNLPCLKTLDVVAHYDPFVTAFKLISGCPVLENLYLEVRRHYKDERDYIFNIPTLKRLELIRVNSTYCINKVVLNVPNLEYLSVRGLLYSVFVMEDVSSLAEASISFRHVKYYHQLVELLKGLIGVKSLSAQILGSYIDYNAFFTSSLPVFPKMKHLELKGYWHPKQIPHFLESFPELTHLCVEKVVNPFFEKLGQYSWVEPKLVPVCMLTKLTTVKFSVCEWWKCDLLFVKYMLGNAKVLKTVEITWEKLRLEEVQTRLCEELLKCPRASRCCEIQFHCN